eukprot:6403687-Prymnesium_polylepis.1
MAAALQSRSTIAAAVGTFAAVATFATFAAVATPSLQRRRAPGTSRGTRNRRRSIRGRRRSAPSRASRWA